jgi:hypothetical protein
LDARISSRLIGETTERAEISKAGTVFGSDALCAAH